MAISVKHQFTSAKSDGPDPTVVQPSNWNAEHAITLGAGKVLGRDTSGAGAVQEIPIAVTTGGDVALSGTGYLTLPKGTTAQRPGVPAQGMLRYNTQLDLLEYYNSTTAAWTGVVSSRFTIERAALASVEDKIINGSFDVWQRATSGTGVGYTACDRWTNLFSGGTVTQSRTTLTTGTLLGKNTPKYTLRQAVTGQSGTSDYAATRQRIEGVRTYAGQTVTVMGWCQRSSGASGNVAVELSQYFGTGGSPSSEVLISPATITPSGTLQPFAATFTLPNIVGKTIGTNGDDALALNLWTSAGSDYAARTNSLGIQTANFDFWGVHIRVGTFTTADVPDYVAPDYGTTLALCQRYCTIGVAGGCTEDGTAFNLGATATGSFIPFPVTMRATPTMTYTDSVGNVSRFSNLSGSTTNQVVTSGSPVDNPSVYGFIPDFQASGAGVSRWFINWVAAAEL